MGEGRVGGGEGAVGEREDGGMVERSWRGSLDFSFTKISLSLSLD